MKTFGEVYAHEVTRLDAMVNPHVCPEVNENRWNWDSDTQEYGSWYERYSLHSFGVIVGFRVLKNNLD